MFYAFLPFSLIAQCLQETEMEKSGDIMIFSHVRMLKDVARTLPKRSDTANARREGNGTVPSQENDVDGLQSI